MHCMKAERNYFTTLYVTAHKSILNAINLLLNMGKLLLSDLFLELICIIFMSVIVLLL